MRKIVFFLFFSWPAYAGIVPNNLEQADTGKPWNITEAQFHDNIQLVSDIYVPIFKAMNVNFWFERQWASKFVQVVGTKYDSQWAHNWSIVIHGGLARRPEVTREGFLLALCHEIGHFVAGYPMRDYSAYASEGSANYYATHVCARKVFGRIAKKEKLINKLRSDSDLCSKVFDDKTAQNVCTYSVFGAKSFADLNMIAAQERRAADIEVKDNFKTSFTNQLWVPTQCMFDTMIAGVLCEKSWDDKLIPTQHNKTCINRPECWYAP